MNLKKSKDAWADGVIAGIAEHYGLDTFICRMVFIILLASPAPVGLLYVVCMCFMDEAKEDVCDSK